MSLFFAVFEQLLAYGQIYLFTVLENYNIFSDICFVY